MYTIKQLHSIFLNKGLDLKYHILVLPYHQQRNFPTQFNVDICYPLLKNDSSVFNFEFNNFRGYFAEYILKGLRVANDDDFCLFLLYLFLQELKSNMLGDLKLAELQYKISTYIESTYHISFGSTRNHSSHLLNLNDLEFLRYTKFEDDDSKLLAICHLCLLTWKNFFFNNIIIERQKNEHITFDVDYYDPNWLGYKVLMNEKVIVNTEKVVIEHIKISE